MSEFNAAALDYIKFVLSSLGIKPTELARMAGVSSTTLTRPLNDRDHKFAISMGTLEKIQEATGYEFAAFLSKDMDVVSRTLDTFVSPSHYMLTDTFYDEYGSGDNGTVIIGSAQVGAWIDKRFFDVAGYTIPIRHPSSSMQRRCVILTIRGNNINAIANDGEMLFCELEHEHSIAYKTGDVAIIERADPDKGIFEISAKLIEVSADGVIHLLDASSDPRFAAASEVLAPSDEVKVVARALYILREPSRRSPAGQMARRGNFA